MNLKRYTGRTSSEALAQVRQELGDDAVVLSTKPVAGGVEVLAMAPEGMRALEAAAATAPAAPMPNAPAASNGVPAWAAPAAPAAPKSRARSFAERLLNRGERVEPTLDMAAAPAEPAARAEPTLGQAAAQPAAQPSAAQRRAAARGGQDVEADVQTLGMSTLTFQDYVRERMLRRRQTELERQQAGSAGAPQPEAASLLDEAASPLGAMLSGITRRGPAEGGRLDDGAPMPPARQARADDGLPAQAALNPPPAAAQPPLRVVASPRREAMNPERRDAVPQLRREPEPVPGRRTVHHEIPLAARREPPAPRLDDDAPLAAGRGRAPAPAAAQPVAPGAGREREEMMAELRSMRSLIEERFGMLAFLDRLHKNPGQVALSQQLFDIGLSPGLVRKLVQALPEGVTDAMAWAAGVLEQNLLTNEAEAAIEDHEGVFALIGPTGVGKTTSTAKIAAAFASKHGAGQLGLITLDAYRVGAHEQLRTYGRILGVPVHTAHDRASLEDLLELLAGKKLVLIDTAGMAQRDHRTRELLEMLSNPVIRKLLVVNAAAQGETVEDVMVGYRAHTCDGVIVSKLDEAVKLGPALDALIRHTARVVGVANGQRVPEDWHRLSANALVQRALHGSGAASWRFNAGEVNLVFAATQAGASAAAERPLAAPAPNGLHA